LALILAILEKHGGLNFGYSDVFVKIVGGLRIDDPGIDLGIAISINSSFKEENIPRHSIYIGELGLNGDIRPVSQLERRTQEAVKLGFTNIFIPKYGEPNSKQYSGSNVKLLKIAHISELIK
jgi:DNA repair protein RadA/Sms